MTGIVCKGSFALGTACGGCDHCVEQIERGAVMRFKSFRVVKPDGKYIGTDEAASRVKELGYVPSDAKVVKVTFPPLDSSRVTVTFSHDTFAFFPVHSAIYRNAVTVNFETGDMELEALWYLKALKDIASHSVCCDARRVAELAMKGEEWGEV